MSGGRRLTGGKAVREAAGLMQIAAGGDLASQRQERVGRGIEVPDREVHVGHQRDLVLYTLR